MIRGLETLLDRLGESACFCSETRISPAWIQYRCKLYPLNKGKELLAPPNQKMLSTFGFRVRMILDVSWHLGDRSHSSQIVARFKDYFFDRKWPGVPWPEVFYDPRGLETDSQLKAVVHVKYVIANDHTAYVSLANLTETAQEKNLEVGVLVEISDKVQQLKAYFKGLLDTS